MSKRIPKTWQCKGCDYKRAPTTVAADAWQIRCRVCGYGHTPFFDTKKELLAWLGGDA